ncbi:hypothetical protein PanWU01x14_326280, partial [Parasponia andersonii]
MIPLPDQESKPKPETCVWHLPTSLPEFGDLDISIALRKGVRSCTQYLISHYISYDHLSPPARAFVTNLSDVEIPHDIKEALQIPKWKQAVMEELWALEKNRTWEIVNKPEGKFPLDANGCLLLSIIPMVLLIGTKIDWCRK